MTTALPVRPGVASYKVLNIPEKWDKQWFRRMLTNHLEGADARNAIAGPGITITGTTGENATISATSKSPGLQDLVTAWQTSTWNNVFTTFQTGLGTPVNAGITTNFNGASATLPQTSAAVAQIITDLINLGFYAS